MPPRFPRGTLATTTIVDQGVSISSVFSPDRRNIIENIGNMRAQIIFNVAAQAEVIAHAMEEDAKINYPWSPQPESIHNPARGYYNDHAHEQITSNVIPDPTNDVIIISLSHPEETVQERTGARGSSDEPVYYGEILELARDGRYAILGPTMEEYAPILANLIATHALDNIDYRGTGRHRRPSRSMIRG
jgi:hypothetical protein